MNNNINIAELLKDCPKGTKLYSTIFGEVELKEVKDNGRSVCILVTNFYGQEEMFYPDGKYNTHYSDSECALFPSKEQRDWSKFCPFKNGDVLSDNYSVFIFKSRMFDRGLDSYVYNSNCVLAPNKRLAVKPGGYNHAAGVVSFASEEEKQKLFQAIKDNGYKWNSETKTLEKLVEPKFKREDIVYTKGGSLAILGGEVNRSFYTICRLRSGRLLTDFILVEPERFTTEEEKEKLFQAIKDNGYRWNAETKTLEKEEKKDKFDITTLKPFDKVLMRDSDTQEWFISLFSHFNGLKMYKYSCINGRGYAQCVPYEGNQHLLGTTNNCDEYYKTWNDETDE